MKHSGVRADETIGCYLIVRPEPMTASSWHRFQDGDVPDEGRVRAVVVDGRSVALSRCGGHLGALENRCPHQGGPLGEASIENGLLRCPWHGYDYDPLTGVPPMGFVDAVPAFAVQESEDGAWVELPDLPEYVPTVDDVVVETLVAWGVTQVCGMVGHSNPGVAEAMRLAEERSRISISTRPSATSPSRPQRFSQAATTLSSSPARRTLASPESIEAAAKLVRKALRPVVVAGDGARAGRAQLLSLAERPGAPILTTFKAKGLVADDHPLAAGVLGRSGTPVASWLMNESDLLLVVGASFSNHTGIATYKTLVCIDDTPTSVGRFASVDVCREVRHTHQARVVGSRFPLARLARNSGQGSSPSGRSLCKIPTSQSRQCSAVPRVRRFAREPSLRPA